MNLYDAESVAAVWQRVRGGDPLKEELQKLLSALQDLEGAYAAMARCSRTGVRLEKTCCCSRRRLSALYALLYGPLPEAARYPACSLRSLREQLRDCFARELRCGETIRQLGEKYPAHRPLFCALARETGCRAECLRNLTEALLFRGS